MKLRMLFGLMIAVLLTFGFSNKSSAQYYHHHHHGYYRAYPRVYVAPAPPVYGYGYYGYGHPYHPHYNHGYYGGGYYGGGHHYHYGHR
jgi:hypothetical protein